MYKTINVITSTILGSIPLLGPAYTLFDNFKDYLVDDWKPNYFIDEIRNNID